MASLYVAFCDIGAMRNGSLITVAEGETVVSATLTTSASNTQSGASTKRFVRVASDAAHFIAIGANPDATTATGRFYIPANSPEYFRIEVGNKLAAVTA